jgi:hypothetical protein
VLEHIPDLNSKISELIGKLADHGILVIAVPNYQSPDALKYKEYWAGYDVPRHLWHFSKKSIASIFAKAGAKIVKIVPMKLDAYYVSILSEKYRNQNRLGIYGIIAGILAGLISNFQAKTDNYSSLIYIVKKS